jgi:hypothetical protein
MNEIDFGYLVKRFFTVYYSELRGKLREATPVSVDHLLQVAANSVKCDLPDI